MFFATKQVQKKWSRADIRCTRLRMALRVFFVSMGIPDCEDLVTVRIYEVLSVQNELSQVWMMDNFSEQ